MPWFHPHAMLSWKKYIKPTIIGYKNWLLYIARNFNIAAVAKIGPDRGTIIWK